MDNFRGGRQQTSNIQLKGDEQWLESDGSNTEYFSVLILYMNLKVRFTKQGLSTVIELNPEESKGA